MKTIETSQKLKLKISNNQPINFASETKKIPELELYPGVTQKTEKMIEKERNFVDLLKMFNDPTIVNRQFFTERDLMIIVLKNSSIINDRELYQTINSHWLFILEAFLSQNSIDISYVVLYFQRHNYRSISEKEYYYWNESKKLWCKENISVMKKTRIISIITNILKTLKVVLLNYENEFEKSVKNVLSLLGKVKTDNRRITNLFLSYINEPKFEDTLDADMYSVPCKNGIIIDLKTGIYRERTCLDRWTKEFPIVYNPNADQSFIRNWINELFLVGIDDKYTEIPNFLQHILGYTISGSVKEQCLFFLLGDGSAGKTSFSNFIRSIFGEFYANVPSGMLTQQYRTKRSSTSSFSSNPFLANLDRKRAVFCNDIDSSLKLVGIKKLIGKEEIDYQNFNENRTKTLHPYFKLFLTCNEIPNIREEERAIIHILKFPAMFISNPDPNKKEQRPKNQYIDEILGLEINKQAMFSWIIEGAIKYFSLPNGLEDIMPNIVKNEDKIIQEEVDKLALYVNDYLEITQSIKDNIGATVLYKHFLEITKTTMTQTEFGRRIKKIIGESVSDNRGRKEYRRVQFKNDPFNQVDLKINA